MIDIVAGQLGQRVCASIDALHAAGVEMFDRGGQLVRPVRLASAESGAGVRRPAGALVLRSVDPDWLRLRLATAASWRRPDRRSSGVWHPADPPQDVGRMVIAAADEGGWPYLRAIVQHPVLCPDGRRIAASGYDAETGLLVDAPGEWPALPELPSRDDAVKAIARLEHLFQHYPWRSETTDKAVALSLVLTALARPVLPAAPAHGITSPVPGTGKSLLVDAVAILATGTPAAVMEFGRDPDEAAKRLDGMLLSGDQLISIDNVETAIEGAALCQTLSQQSRRVRPLGDSKPVTVPCAATITLTGNNLTLKGDVVRRALVCRLDAECEAPEQREIEQDLLAEVREHRGELVHDAQTIMAAYIAAGSPKQKPDLGGYREWSRLVRSALI